MDTESGLLSDCKGSLADDLLILSFISDKKKYRSPSQKRGRKKLKADQVEIRIAIKKTKIIACWVHHPNTPTPSSDQTLDMNRAEKRAHIRAEFKQKIRDRFGLPRDATFIFRTEHGKQKHLSLTFGTVVLLNKYGTKLLAVVRFNKRQYTGKRLNTGKLKCELVPECAKLFENFNNSIMTLYQHGTARYRCVTNGAAEALKHMKSGQMFVMGFRGGYRQKKYGGPYALNPTTAHLVA
ncbi:uncharacterized protein MELLADRAFT_86826 [Melampsora larici-populina 98AG31]|uniref:Uncharacterized protein n=1 Tax=Melampsora larici-populina (strain 98AG31 / pathotype 3-4-7) TaxID=747676 RepID=F4R3J4_MELLP|nr:uncharacterized protein MELLADRAFT_86826 [Melampsora larici-populina 98AG31]EGG12638.1 hypothetical protein MELLADRAFT_86826 [Melampsora larici-populina 98AG31]